MNKKQQQIQLLHIINNTINQTLKKLSINPDYQEQDEKAEQRYNELFNNPHKTRIVRI